MIKETVISWSSHRCSMMGAALAYYSIFSFGPLLVISTAIAGLVFGPDAVHGEIAAQVAGLLGSAGAQALETLLAAANRPYQGALATIFGIGTLLFAAVGVVAQLKEALNTVWGVETSKQQRPFTIDPQLRHFARGRAVARIFAVGVADLHGGACGNRQIRRALFSGSRVPNRRIGRFLRLRDHPVCNDVQMAARHGGRLARRLARRRIDRGAVRNRKISDRLLCRQTGTGIDLWRGHFARHAFDLGLLFRSNRSVRRGIHPRLCRAARHTRAEPLVRVKALSPATASRD